MAFTFTLANQTRLQVDASPTSFFLSADDVEKLIAELAHFRSQMSPEVPKQAPSGQHQMIADPAFSGAVTASGGLALGLRHSGIGWLFYFFPQAEARKLSSALAQFVTRMSSPPSGSSRRH